MNDIERIKAAIEDSGSTCAICGAQAKTHVKTPYGEAVACSKCGMSGVFTGLDPVMTKSWVMGLVMDKNWPSDGSTDVIINKFGIGTNGEDKIVMLMPPRGWMTKADAINLSVWLAVIAGDRDEWNRVVGLVEST